VRELGGMTVSEAEERFSSQEITEWQAFFTLEHKRSKRKGKSAEEV
jgi:hypothetical protein